MYILNDLQVIDSSIKVIDARGEGDSAWYLKQGYGYDGILYLWIATNGDPVAFVDDCDHRDHIIESFSGIAKVLQDAVANMRANFDRNDCAQAQLDYFDSYFL